MQPQLFSQLPGRVLKATLCAIVIFPWGFTAANADPAPCPISLESIVDIGRAASGGYESYQVAVTGPAGKVSSIEFLLRTSDSDAQVRTSWQDVTLARETRVAFKWKTPRALGTVDRPTPDIAAGAIDQVVVTPGAQPVTCDPAWQTTSDVQSDFGLVITQVDTIDDSTRPMNAAVQSFRHYDHVGAGVLSQNDYGYPREQMFKGIQGESIVEVRFDAAGKPKAFSIMSSSQDDALDANSLADARMTNFAPPLRDGKPDPDGWTELNYFYPRGFDGTNAAKDSCPAQIDTAVLANAGQSNNPNWYRILASTDEKNVISFQVEIQDSTGSVTAVPWIAPDLSPAPGGDARYPVARGEFAWAMPAVTKIWIGSVAFANGNAIACKRYYAVVDQPSPTAMLERVGAVAPAATSIISLDPASYVRVVHPTYPPLELKSHLTGRVFVSTIIDALGDPMSSFIVGSSGNPDFDKAALDAAMSSSYSATALGASPRAVWTTYGFLDEPGGDAFFRNRN
jgi:TonB family protein